ncbi:MAG TPA: hypothetical protein VLF79_00510 [Candidatus Saccharimonadales bacterium]|nr:hypothetical protein [Candidatus Saccharimonadales bacterium]
MKHNQKGAISGLAVSLVFTIVLLIGALAFGVWAFSGRQDYKDNVDFKISRAVSQAKQAQNAADQSLFNEEAKQPLTSYQGPEAFGSIQVKYPKNWSAYVNASGGNNAQLDGYFAPGAVPSVTDQNSIFALRAQVISQAYASVLQNFSGQQKSGKLTISAYALPKLPKVVGVKVNGQLNGQGPVTTMVVLPLRSQTLEISTQGTTYLNDFNNNILPNFTFSP